MSHLHQTTHIPADVPASSEQEYSKNLSLITKNSGKLMLFACDQKIEHMYKDFYGPTIHPDAALPEHMFNIASRGSIGAFATHLGLIARYGKRFNTINYIIKLNGKTDLISTEHKEPFSQQLWSIYDVISFKKSSGLPIAGVGYTLYLGSEYEDEMLSQAAETIFEAHQYGLVTILWVYLRGKNIQDDQDAMLLAGAAGIATSLGADFVKIKPPKNSNDLAMITQAAGNTGVICSGGKTVEPELFLHNLQMQLQQGNVKGCATGRNIFQKSVPEAIAFTHAIAAIVYENKDAQEALRIYTEKLS